MIDTVQKVVRLTMMLNDNERVSVRKIQSEFGLSRSTTYRWLKSVSKELPIKTDGGVVRMEKKSEVKRDARDGGPVRPLQP